MTSVAEPIVIVGDREMAELAFEYFTYDSPHTIVAFTVEDAFLTRKSLFDRPVVPFEKVDHLYDPKSHKIFVAISYVQLNRVRTRLYQMAKAKGYSAASYISSQALVWRNAIVGENCFILEHNIIQYGVRVGNNVTMWSANHIGHHSVIGDNCFITGHVVVSGHCEIGENCFLGANSCVGDHVTVAKDCVIGAGAVLLKNTEPKQVYRGNPATPSHINSVQAFGLGDSEDGLGT
ncbi:MAG TPA: acetyltransferase [Pyrinomonadaceae bacterium]|nr:acetyltransferase [Pyrinomonadaceae bacterium]